MASSDKHIYCDNEREYRFCRRIMVEAGEAYITEICVNAFESGLHYAEFYCDPRLVTEINGETKDSSMTPLFSRRLPLKEGENSVKIVVSNPLDRTVESELKVRIIDPSGSVLPDISTFARGIGSGIDSCGRFGYTKGDGVLDCSMTKFGIVGKPHISGDPRYKKTLLWHISLLPPGISPVGNLSSVYTPGEDEKIDVSWTGVEWERSVKASEEFYSRKKGDKVFFKLTYSLLTPAIVMETDDPALRLGHCSSRRIMLPLENGIVTRMSENRIFYDKKKDGPLKENWIMFFDSNEFPEIPVLYILNRSPEKITDDIDIVFDGAVGWAMFEFPFGFQSFEPLELDRDWIEKAEWQCRNLHTQALAYPVECCEYYKIRKNEVMVLQHFRYRFFEDSNHAVPVRTAPLPPVLTIREREEIFPDPAAVNLNFPTKYGPLFAVRNRCWNSYTLPVPDCRREYPLLPEKIRFEDFEEYLAYHKEHFKEMYNPGVHQLMYQYLIPLFLFQRLDENQRKELENILEKNLENACNKDFIYYGPKGKECRAWYERTEPFSNVKYFMSYLHVNRIHILPDGKRETIEQYPDPFIEVDWGNGLALYSMYHSALFTGRWDIIKQNWNLIKKIFHYFLCFQDWACMTAPSSEGGNLWNDGTNYGAYLGFLGMAEQIGDRECQEQATYAYAKMVAERLGQFSAAETYFPGFYKQEPYFSLKTFQSETSLQTSFTNYPKPVLMGNYREESLYNMTTEGFYPETMKMYAELAPRELDSLLTSLEKSNGALLNNSMPDIFYYSNPWKTGKHEVASYILLCLFSNRCSKEYLLDFLETAYRNHRIPEDFFGTELSYRRIPAEWTHEYLRTMIEMHDYPSLANWEEIRILRFSSCGMEIEITGRKAFMEFRSNKKFSVELNGKILCGKKEGKGILFSIPESGKLKITLNQEGISE